jgi:hypothetical protein
MFLQYEAIEKGIYEGGSNPGKTQSIASQGYMYTLACIAAYV